MQTDPRLPFPAARGRAPAFAGRRRAEPGAFLLRSLLSDLLLVRLALVLVAIALACAVDRAG